MGLLGRGNGGGLMNVIRCDQEDYMIWKWRPEGQDANSTSRENSIRFGSSLRVKDGEVAVFVYKQQNGICQDFIEGPYDGMIKTENLPVLTNIIGLAFGGESPFQAEVYFINTSGVNQVKFTVPYFDVFDPRFPDHGVPLAARGTLTFKISDYKAFIKLHRLIGFDHEQFMQQVKAAAMKYVKGIVSNVPQEMGIPVVQMERQILTISDRISEYMKPILSEDFGVDMRRFDVSSLDLDKESPCYEELRSLTAGLTAETIRAQNEVNIKNLHDMQAVNVENVQESMRIQREETQRAQRLQSETNFIGAHTANLQADVLKTGAQNLGQMGSVDMGSGGSTMNPAGMMTGMMMGGAMGQQMAGMMNNMGQQMQQGAGTPPPLPNVSFFVAVNGAQSGPFMMNQLAQMAQSGQITPETLVWKQGMPNWSPASTVPELMTLFAPPAPGAMPPPFP